MISADLAHLTLNTNDLRRSPRAEVSAAAIRALAPWTRATADRLPLPGGMRLSAGTQLGDGFAQLSVWGSPLLQVASAVVVWTPEGDDAIWPRLVDAARRAGTIAGQLRKPASLPWLAVTLLPPAAGLSPDTLMALADLERCWAWAVLEALT